LAPEASVHAGGAVASGSRREAEANGSPTSVTEECAGFPCCDTLASRPRRANRRRAHEAGCGKDNSLGGSAGSPL